MTSHGKNGEANEFHSVLDSLRSDLSALRGDVASLREDTVALGKAGVKSAAHRVGDGIEDIAGKARATAERAADGVGHTTEDLRAAIVANPLLSVAAAVALGFAVGKGMVRR